MTQAAVPQSALAPQAVGRPTVWGLTARQLHDAYWRCWGVQCIRRGEWQPISGAAELFLVMEPAQLVLFDLSQLTERLIWRKALVTRLRVSDQEDDDYSEQVVTDDRGLVEKIERRYRPRTCNACRVMLTSSRRIARTWMSASTRREGWDTVRRTVPWSGRDHLRCRGGCFSEGDHAQEQALIRRLVACWPEPAQAIDGLQEAGEGVWMVAGDAVPADAVLVGPLWLGDGGNQDRNLCLVGPAWTPDRPRAKEPDLARVLVRDISDIEMLETPRNIRASADRRIGYAVAKRTLDIVASFVILLLSLPLFTVVAVCILWEDGRPVFYRHLRQSRGGRPFWCWKFRSMYRNASNLTPALASENICDGPQVFLRHDPRVTRVGNILRRFQIDEFPQFWNVLIGEMSIVGPRPSPDEENQYCPAWRDLRLSVRPGITGLWQLERTRAPGQDFQEWIKYDIEYVRRASFWFDLSLCAKTAWVLLLGKRA